MTTQIPVKTRSEKIKDYVSIAVGVSIAGYIDYIFIMCVWYDLSVGGFFFRLFFSLLAGVVYFRAVYGD